MGRSDREPLPRDVGVSPVAAEPGSPSLAHRRPSRRRGNGGFGRATCDARHARPTFDNATCDGRKSKSRDVARACRASHVARPALKSTKNFFQLFFPHPLRSPLAFATLATVSDGPGLPKRRGQPPFPFGLKGKTNEKANVCNGPRGVRCSLR